MTAETKTLAEYIAKRGTAKGVAIDAGLEYNTVYKIATYIQRARVETAFKIEMATKGTVRAESMVRQDDLSVVAYLRGIHAQSH